MLGMTVRQASQVKVARRSSGRTSEVRVTVAEIEVRVPIWAVRRERMRVVTGRLWKPMEKTLSVAGSTCGVLICD